MKAILLGDAMIPGKGFGDAWKKHMSKYGEDIIVDNWESDWGSFSTVAWKWKKEDRRLRLLTRRS